MDGGWKLDSHVTNFRHLAVCLVQRVAAPVSSTRTLTAGHGSMQHHCEKGEREVENMLWFMGVGVWEQTDS